MIYDIYGKENNRGHYLITYRKSFFVLNGHYSLLEIDNKIFVPITDIEVKLLGNIEGEYIQDYNWSTYTSNQVSKIFDRFANGERATPDICK